MSLAFVSRGVDIGEAVGVCGVIALDYLSGVDLISRVVYIQCIVFLHSNELPMHGY